MTTAALQIPGPDTRNPFVEIAPEHRAIMIAYFLVWQLMPTTVLLFKTESASAAVLGLTLVGEAVVIFFSVLPFMIKRIGHMPMGWLNPLVLLPLLRAVSAIVQEPLHVAEPILVWFREPGRLEHRLLTYHDLEAVQWVYLTVLSFAIVGAISFLVSYWFFKPPLPRRPDTSTQKLPQAPDLYFIALFGVLCMAFFALLLLNGGLAEHFNSLANGRFSMRKQGLGPLLVAVDFMPILLVIWYLSKPSVLQNPLFFVFLAISLVFQFLADGSRSSVVIPVVTLTAAWMYRTHRVPVRGAVLLMFLAVIGLATLGEVRKDRDSNTETATAVLIENLDIAETVEEMDRQKRSRSAVSGPIAIATRVPHDRDFLYGKSYVGGLFFFIPRSFWQDKPRGSGAHVNAILFHDYADASNFTGSSFPASASGEAFWNFGYLGIVLVFSLFGAFQRWLSERVLRYPDNWQYVTIMLLAATMFRSPDTDLFVPYIQVFVLTVLTFFGMRVFSVRRAIPSADRAPNTGLRPGVARS